MCNSKDVTPIPPEIPEKTTQIEETPKSADSADALTRDKSNRSNSDDSSSSTLAHPQGYNNEVPTDDKLGELSLENLKAEGK